LTAASPGADVFFFDEARFGLKPAVGRRWARRGGRTVAVVRPGYKNFYAHGAVCPATGEDFTLVLPRVCTALMQVFLDQMAGHLCGRECILVMDRAGWHVSKELRVPPNITIVLLPPYSPELNPVERLWQWVKRHAIRNRLFLRLEEVMDAVGGCLKSMTAEFLRGICRCGYLSH
jgi:transposase